MLPLVSFVTGGSLAFLDICWDKHKQRKLNEMSGKIKKKDKLIQPSVISRVFRLGVSDSVACF